MIKNVLAVSAVTAMLLLSGCSNDAEDKMGLQQDLDNGNNGSVISALEDKETRTDSENLMLASAYMDEAGLSVIDLIGLVSDGEGSGFASFVKSINEEKTPETLDNLQKAIDYYNEILNPPVAKAPSMASSSDGLDDAGTIELYLGLAYITKVSTVMSYMGNVDKWETEGTDADLMATGCAMTDIYNQGLAQNSNCLAVTRTGLIVDVNNVKYEGLTVKIDADPKGNYPAGTYYRLANSTFSDVVLTDYESAATDKFAKGQSPVKGDKLTIEESLTDTLTAGFDSIIKAAPEDTQEDVAGYRDEIDTNRDKKISIEEFTIYMNDEA